MEIFLKQKKGITLIALVITIIVLLILAGISISMISENNGILRQAGNAKNLTEQAQLEGDVDIAYVSFAGQLRETNDLE